MNNTISVFYGIDDAVAAESMRAVDDVLSDYFRDKHGLEIGTYGAKWAVRRTDGLQSDGVFEYTAYSYADCVKWMLTKPNDISPGRT